MEVAMKVSDVMTAHPWSIDRKDSLQQAARLMAENDCGSLPVTDNDRVCGVITDRDITVRAVADGTSPNDCVETAMTPDVVTIGSQAQTGEASQMMADNQLHRLYVVDQGGLVGVVALADLANLGADGQAAQALEGISQ
jgi:IMP dehydrogenase